MDLLARKPLAQPRWLLALLTLSLLASACESEAQRAKKAEEATYREKYAKAEALFKERCKTAGGVIHRTVKDVEGIELTKVRQRVPWGGKEYFDPMWAEAAMAGEHRGDDYIKQFLMCEFIHPQLPNERGVLGPKTWKPPGLDMPRKDGYRFVEVLDAKTGRRSRCAIPWKPGESSWVASQQVCEPVEKSLTRYALDFEDIVDAADRQLWVAGTRLKVIDKQTGEVIAQLTKYIWDPGFGASTTGRWPWQHADNFGPSRNCPSTAGIKADFSRKFIDTVLSPKQGD
jgi:hypothetical protein